MRQEWTGAKRIVVKVGSALLAPEGCLDPVRVGMLAAQIARVLDTTGFISSDHHVHGIASSDSRVSDSDRVRQFAGEGVDNVIMTDHQVHTDLTPTIDALGFTDFVTATVGEVRPVAGGVRHLSQ